MEVKYLLPISSSDTNVYICHYIPESPGMRKILAHGISMQKNPQTRVDIF